MLLTCAPPRGAREDYPGAWVELCRWEVLSIVKLRSYSPDSWGFANLDCLVSGQVVYRQGMYWARACVSRNNVGVSEAYIKPIHTCTHVYRHKPLGGGGVL